MNEKRPPSYANLLEESVTAEDIQYLKSLLKGITVSRLTLPNDANIHGNVHGGTILKFIEEAGMIIATRYCNTAKPKKNTEPMVATMVRIEHMDFFEPMHIGEVAELTAEIKYTSLHSLLVEVDVYAENVILGVKRLTNRAKLWYVGMSFMGVVMPVPSMPYEDEEMRRRGRLDYETQKIDREKNEKTIVEMPKFTIQMTDEIETVPYSMSFLSLLVGPNDVTMSRHCRGGVLLKLIDECAAIVAVKHCHSSVVTACLNATNFYSMINIGSLVTVFGRATFTSARSMEIEVMVESESSLNGEIIRKKAVDAFLTYVSLDSNRKAQPIPPLKIKTPEEQQRYDAGLARYNARKQAKLKE